MGGKNKRLIGGVSANVFLLGVVSLFTDMSSEIITPILPFFITSLGGTGIIVGLIGGFSDSISSILTLLSGYWSDKTGKRKVFVSAGYGLSSLAKLLLAFSTSWVHVLLLKPLERVGKGLRTAPRDAIIAESKKEVRGRSFGIHRAMDGSGAVIGSILALVLLSAYKLSFESMILLAGALGFLALIPLFFVKEKHKTPQDITLKFGLKSLPQEFKVFLVVIGIFALGNFTNLFFILQAQEAYTGELHIPFIDSGVAVALLLYVWFNIVDAPLSYVAGILSDRMDKGKILVIAYLTFSLTCIGFAMFQSLPMMFVLFAMYGLFYAFMDVSQRVIASDLVNEELRGTALGTFHTTIAISTLPAGVIAGALWQYFSPQATFFYGAGMGLLAAILFSACCRPQRASF